MFTPATIRVRNSGGLLLGLLAAGTLLAADPEGERLSALRRFALPNGTITSVERVPTGTFVPPNGAPALPNLPAFCRVCAAVKSSPDSNICMEVWLPEQNWNGRFLATGSSGSAGKITYNTTASGLQLGYAVANCDLGTAPNPEVLLDHPERWADFGSRGTHAMTVAAKAIVRAHYGKAPRYSYFVGGSTGGQQSLVEAQRYPDDFDGIIAGGPGNNRTHLHMMFLWNWAALHREPGSAFSPADVALISRAVVRARAKDDGGAPDDDFLTDPRLCRFDPAELLAPIGQTAADHFLTRAQVTALQKIYAGPVNPRTGERIYTAAPVGSERALGLVLPEDPNALPPHSYLFRWVFGAGFDYAKFDFDRDVDQVDARLAAILNANNPDLSALQKRGGKILMYTGTADPVTPFQDALNYYERVIEFNGGLEKTQAFFRYFVVPGLGHVAGGPGLNDFGQRLILDVTPDADHDAFRALVLWVEHGVPPDRIIATAFKGGDAANGIRFLRPIYPYPKFPHYIGGDPNSPSSYRGVDHPHGNVPVPAPRYLN